MNPRALFYLLATNFLGGSSYAATTYALRGFAPEAAAFWRTLAGAVLFAPFLWLRPLPRLTRGDWLRLAAVGTLGYALPLTLGFMGQRLSSSTNASLLIGVEPVSIVLLSAAFLGERLTPLKGVSVLAGLAGSALIVLQGLPGPGVGMTASVRGDLILVAHGFCWALYSVIAKPLLRRIDVMGFTAITMLFAALALAPLASLPGQPVPPAAWGGMAYLIVAVTLLGTMYWNKALELVPASTLANFIFLQPLVGAGLGTLLHGDKLSPWSAAGGALILLSVYGATREEAQHEVKAPSISAPGESHENQSLRV